MKGFLIFIVGFVAGVVAMIFANKTDVVGKEPTQDGLIGLTVFPEKGECITTLSKKESTELDILQVIEPIKHWEILETIPIKTCTVMITIETMIFQTISLSYLSMIKAKLFMTIKN